MGEIEGARANPAGGADYFTNYTYDALDNLNQVSMPRPSGTQTRTFVYNGKLLLSATNPENGKVSYTYNSYNKVATKTDAIGQVITYIYDTLGRLKTAGPSGDTCQQVNYYYDSNPFNPGYSQYSLGRLTAVQYSAPVFNYGCGTTFTEQYSYNQAGAKTNKGLLITRTLQWQGTCCGNNPPTGSGPSTADLESSYTYDNEGRMLAVQYPGSTSGTAGPNLGYAYDTMGRLNTMTDLAASSSIISATSYDSASRLLSITGSSFNESRSYNVMGQLTSLSSNYVNMAYSYSATQNNGKITGQTDYTTGETLVYAYDALNRLASAAATNNSWGQSYSYDGFGNLTDQTVTAGPNSIPNLHTVYSASNNRQTSDCADANGNINAASTCGSNGYGYDVENRIVSVPGQQYLQYTRYAYAPGNKRVWRGTTTYNQSTGTSSLTVDEITFWSVTGQKLATYAVTGDPSVVYSWDNYDHMPTPAVTVALATSNYYFGGELIGKANSGYVTYSGADRLGSKGKFYPWGQEKPSATTNGTEKFTGYFRDSETQLDYAENRYHQPGVGRFLTVDPSAESWELEDPGSWNSYAYVGGDPINNSDPNGLTKCGDLIDTATGQAVRAEMQLGSDLDMLAKMMWHEAGPVLDSDKSNLGAFDEEQLMIGTALENRLAIATGAVKVVDGSGNPAFTGFQGKNLFDIILQAAVTRSGSIFNPNGTFVTSENTKLQQALNADIGQGDQFSISSGYVQDATSVTQICYGVLRAITNAHSILNGTRDNGGLSGVLLTSWNKAANSPPGYESATVGPVRQGGNTFYGYPLAVKRPPGHPRPKH